MAKLLNQSIYNLGKRGKNSSFTFRFSTAYLIAKSAIGATDKSQMKNDTRGLRDDSNQVKRTRQDIFFTATRERISISRGEKIYLFLLDQFDVAMIFEQHK